MIPKTVSGNRERKSCDWQGLGLRALCKGGEVQLHWTENRGLVVPYEEMGCYYLKKRDGS